MKTSAYKICISICIALLITGCEDFLEKEPQGKLTQTSFPVTPSDALLATNAAYYSIRHELFHFGLFPIIDIMSDDAHKGSNPEDQKSTIGLFDNFTFASTDEDLARWWATLYECIKYTNVVIENVPTIEMDQTLRSRYVGEAQFIRALCYFDLVRAWGGVPIVTTLNPPLQLQRASVEEVYALIISDLTNCLNTLMEKDQMPASDLGRATKGAARALLAKVYLFQKDYVNAEKYALEVINSGKYGLEPVFTGANGVNGEHGIESVFETGADTTETYRGAGDRYGNVQGVRGSPNRGWGFNRPSVALRNSFEPGDPRLKGTIIDLGDVLDGITIAGDGNTPDVTRDNNGNIIEIECYNRKVWTPGQFVPTQFGHNRRHIRYADVLLMAAEALNENNKPGDALIYLNMVRARARQGNPAILPDITETNKDLLRNAILNERRHELAMESHRFWDLVRTDRAEAVLGPLGFVKGKHELLPIPQAERDISQGTLMQNPNW